jgi:hypothetical protein
MDSPVRRKWLLITFLLIMALLISWSAFWLSGVLSEPPEQETIAVEAVSWNMSRPSDFKRVEELVNNSYTDSGVSVNLFVHVFEYYENNQGWAGFDVVWSKVLVNISVNDGFVESLIVNFTELDNHAALDIHDDIDRIEVVNLEIAKIVDWDWVFGRNAYIKTMSTNHSENAYLEFLFAWMFRDEHNVDHQLAVTLGATIFNGTSYQRIEMPIQMRAHAMTSIVTIS